MVVDTFDADDLIWYLRNGSDDIGPFLKPEDITDKTLKIIIQVIDEDGTKVQTSLKNGEFVWEDWEES